MGVSMQKQSGVTRSESYRGHAIDVDQDDCYGRLFFNALERESIYNDDEYLMVKLSTVFHSNWRSCLAAYRGCEPAGAKTAILCVRFGSVPHEDIPFLRLLASQVRKGAMALLALPKYARFNMLYTDRKNPISVDWQLYSALMKRRIRSVLQTNWRRSTVFHMSGCSMGRCSLAKAAASSCGYATNSNICLSS